MISLKDIIKHKSVPLFTPKWLKRITYFTPSAVLNSALSQHLNSLFHAQIAAGELEFLENKCICIDINNLALSVLVSLEQQTQKIKVLTLKSAFILQTMGRYDGKLSGSSDSFLQLIAGKSDPDTLFFRRQLTIEGDTELCLMFKNWLDTQDAEGKLPSLLYADLQHYVDTIG